MNIRNVVKTAQEVKNLSFVNETNHTLQAGDISNIATVLEKIVTVKRKANEVGYMKFKYFFMIWCAQHRVIRKLVLV